MRWTPSDETLHDRLAESRAREEKLSADLRKLQEDNQNLQVRIRALYAGYFLVAFTMILVWQVAK